jgi:hypothetical protein
METMYYIGAQQTSAGGIDRGGKNGAAKQPRTGDGLRTGETKRPCQPRNTGRGAEDGGVPGHCRSPSKRLSGKQLPERAGEKKATQKGGSFQNFERLYSLMTWSAHSTRET